MPRKMVSAQMQEFDLLSPQQQDVVKVASTFKAFTPAMVADVLQATSLKMPADELNRVWLYWIVFWNARTYLITFSSLKIFQELVRVDVIAACGYIPQSVSEYHPTDLTASSSYQFVSKLFQQQVCSDYFAAFASLMVLILGRFCPVCRSSGKTIWLTT